MTQKNKGKYNGNVMSIQVNAHVYCGLSTCRRQRNKVCV